MIKNIFAICLFSMLLCTCSKKKIEKTTQSKSEKETTVVKKGSPQTSPTSPQAEVKTANIPASIEPNLIAKIKRTPCYGKCPVFTIELYNNGVAKYTGDFFVEKKGVFTAKVSPEFIKKIQDKALSIKYLSLENKYPIASVEIADLPTTTTYIKIGDVGKQILDNFDAPKELIEFETWLEREFNSLEWKAQ